MTLMRSGWRRCALAFLGVGLYAVAIIALRWQAGSLQITYPLDGAVFPPEIIAPTFRWTDTNRRVDHWWITVTLSGSQEPVDLHVSSPQWTPDEELWSRMKRQSVEQAALIAIRGVHGASSTEGLSADEVRIAVSADPVGASLFYREVNLPFKDAFRDPSRIRWRFGSVACEQPPIVLENLPVCANCHSFSADGSTLGMDVDYANDKGSYAIVPVQSEMALDRRSVITWSDYRREDGVMTFGLLSQVSPDGRYVVSTVKDESVFVATSDLTYSQLFFPVKGVLVVYDRQTGSFQALPGADNPRYVQSNPTWSPDGKEVVFIRSEVHALNRRGRGTLLTQDECAEFLKEGKLFRYDLYRVPFNDGRGGKALPVEGASNNGMSNYFPKYSPDGKWIVFCRARSFSLLQPDSQLFIIPAGGGPARQLRCNTERMNSWHSWSPNGKWLVFSSKSNGPYTQLWLTHVDQHGCTTPPIVLDHFTASDRAANIPEFVNIPEGTIHRIRERFLDDHSYARSADAAFFYGDQVNAERRIRKALEINPDNARAGFNLMVLLLETGREQEALRHAVALTEGSTASVKIRFGVGTELAKYGKYRESLEPFRSAIRLQPDCAVAHWWLGLSLSVLGENEAAIESLKTAVRLEPAELDGRLALADVLAKAGHEQEAVAEYRRVLELHPDVVVALTSLAGILASAETGELRNGSEAVRLATRACELSQHRVPASLLALAAAHAERGDFGKAANVAAKALQRARDEKDERLTARSHQLSELFARGKPFRSPASFWQ